MRAKAANNSVGSKQAVPMPRDFKGGSKDFGMLRILDGHLPSTLGDPNCHYPNDGDSPYWDEDFVIDDNQDFSDPNNY